MVRAGAPGTRCAVAVDTKVVAGRGHRIGQPPGVLKLDAQARGHVGGKPEGLLDLGHARLAAIRDEREHLPIHAEIVYPVMPSLSARSAPPGYPTGGVATRPAAVAVNWLNMADLDPRTLLRQIPAVGSLLDDPATADLFADYPRSRVIAALQEVLGDLRRHIQAGAPVAPDAERIRQEARAILRRDFLPHLVRVVNATGVVLNTNLGRAPLSEQALLRAVEVGAAYSNLEFDLETGRRGKRKSHLEPLLARLCGAEAATVVNNNAAAVLLVVDTLARGQEVVVSRGELVEIGGSFRIPDVITASGAQLKEVGTTNKTRPDDFERAIGDRTGMLLKCHRSNFKLVGFTEEVDATELAAIAHRHDLPAVLDLGSGTLVDLALHGLPHEPTVPEAIQADVDLVTFSGDKLLGGPQAGIIAGKRHVIERLEQNPLIRALRLDKTVIAMLEATLRLYLDPERVFSSVPALAMLAAPPESLAPRARLLAARLSALGLDAVAAPACSAPGGGSLPGVELATWVVRIGPGPELQGDRDPGRLREGQGPDGGVSVQLLASRLRTASTPVLGRLSDGALVLDVRTLLAGDDDRIAAAVGEVLGVEAIGPAKGTR